MGDDYRGRTPYVRHMESLLEFTGVAAYVLVGLLAMAESGFFVGVVVPGETAMILGGVLVSQGHADLGWMLAAASLGGVVGDSISYEIGRRFGPRLMTTRLGRRVGEERWDRARDYVKARGGRAVFFGRFVGVLRALVPAMAGWAAMPYRSFLGFNVAGGVIWATGSIMIGVVAGRSWELVEAWVGQASVIVAIGVVVGLVFVFTFKRVRSERQPLRASVSGGSRTGPEETAVVRKTSPAPSVVSRMRMCSSAARPETSTQ